MLTVATSLGDVRQCRGGARRRSIRLEGIGSSRVEHEEQDVGEHRYRRWLGKDLLR